MRGNEAIVRQSAETRAKEGDLVIVREFESTLDEEGVHRKLVHEKWNGPRTVTSVITPGFCCRVAPNGRRIRERRAAASHNKRYHVRPVEMRHELGDGHAHCTWGADLDLTEPSTVASPMYTLVDRRAVHEKTGTWRWEYRRRCLNGAEPERITEAEALDSFTYL